ncbi:hypothetical protein [Thermoclostridium caenicola]|uniref:Repeat domain-containing protein n=1 Tax=Thermoclostridium caenicola TaxID=659425 RepID=A0A1M6ADR9_9FIRM|nr:hypothetical protein [Thermoclostridium caenicola]SHI34704.1 hypothetical protein SAMN05444373_10014 [Thermoclostridium caenicola]
MKKAIALVLSILSVVLLYCGCARMAAEHSIPDSSDNVANIEPSIPEASAEEPVIPTPTPAASTTAPEPRGTATNTPSISEEFNTENEEPNSFNAIISAISVDGIVDNGLLIGATKDGSWHTMEDLGLPEHIRKVHGGFLIGASEDGPWYTMEELGLSKNILENPDIPYARGGETYYLYSKNGCVGTVVGEKPILHLNIGGLEKVFNVKFTPIEANESYLIGITGDWNPLPRRPSQTKDMDFLVDLDGDGKQEHFRFTSKKSEKPNGTDIMMAIYTDDKSKPVAETMVVYNLVKGAKYDISTMDLNGDGILEIITMHLGSSYVAVSVYEFKNNNLQEVLSSYTGN